MRKKSLLVSANAPMTGPVVFLEAGLWILDTPGLDVDVDISTTDVEDSRVINGQISITGPTKIFAELKKGLNVSLAIRQVARA